MKYFGKRVKFNVLSSRVAVYALLLTRSAVGSIVSLTSSTPMLPRMSLSIASSASRPCCALPLISARRSLSLPSAIPQTTTNPTSESSAVTRIARLLEFGDKMSHTDAVGVAPRRLRGQGSWSARNAAKSADTTEETLPPLPKTRRMQDSYVQLDLPFSKDASLLEHYVGGLAKIRMGALMEDFDSVAGAAAYRHVLPDGAAVSDASKHGLYLVTAAVDRMDVLYPLSNFDRAIPDLRLSGHVSFATESSLEVFVRLSTVPSNQEAPITILVGRFAMACRKYSGGKQPIAQLRVEGEAEEELWEVGKESKERKKLSSLSALSKHPPDLNEAKLLHDLFVGRAEIFERNATIPADVCFMSDTQLNSAQLMHPQQRNVHNKIFGGFLMRLAYESAYSTACLFARNPVTFVALDEIHFALPVEVGSLLLLDSKVTFSPVKGSHKSFHVSVQAATTDLYTGEKKVTNTFHFTFASDKPLDRHVLPRSYKQAMSWLDAQRRRSVGIQVRKGYNSLA